MQKSLMNSNRKGSAKMGGKSRAVLHKSSADKRSIYGAPCALTTDWYAHGI
jgi:hypothetical protein